MMQTWTVPQVDEAALHRLAEHIALRLRTGDTLSLTGDLGAGKTTFARALIRALLDDTGAEVPSPTFSIVQTYDTPRLLVAHLDLYRLTHEEETAELGLEDLRAKGALMVEWAERAPSVLGPDHLDITLIESAGGAARDVTFTARGSWVPRLQRTAALHAFLESLPQWREATIRYLQGDASARAYARVATDGATALVMDWPRQPDGPPIRNGLPYSRIAHLAEDVRAFVAVDDVLRKHGFAAPEILAADLDNGFLVLEHLGERVFGREVAAGQPMLPMWQAATDVLVDMRALSGEAFSRLPIGFGSTETHAVPPYDEGALMIETELVPDWYWPMIKGAPASEVVRRTFAAHWAPLVATVLAAAPVLVLRDYHSPNLLMLDGRAGKASVGLIDFQDAMLGHPAYDLVSLLQDARLDVPETIESRLLDHYCAAVSRREPGFDAAAFRTAYAILGAQRNTKILGIFARLAKRDGKTQYLAHIPRIWRYLERNLAHPGLIGLRGWYDEHFPAARRLDAPSHT